MNFIYLKRSKDVIFLGQFSWNKSCSDISIPIRKET